MEVGEVGRESHAGVLPGSLRTLPRSGENSAPRAPYSQPRSSEQLRAAAERSDGSLPCAPAEQRPHQRRRCRPPLPFLEQSALAWKETAKAPKAGGCRGRDPSAVPQRLREGQPHCPWGARRPEAQGPGSLDRGRSCPGPALPPPSLWWETTWNRKPTRNPPSCAAHVCVCTCTPPHTHLLLRQTPIPSCLVRGTETPVPGEAGRSWKRSQREPPGTAPLGFTEPLLQLQFR